MNDSKIPLISIIIPTYNRANVICNAIASALSQTYKNIEIIVVDDCSTDNTLEKIKYFGEKIKVIKHSVNMHVSAARNTGMNNAQGSYLAFLDSDDEWRENKIELQIAFMQKFDYDISCTDFESNYLEGRGVEVKKRPYNEIKLKDCLWGIYFAPGSTLVIKKNILKIIGGYNLRYKRIEDWELFIRLLSSDFKVGYMQVCTTKIYSSNSFTINNLEFHCKMLLNESKERLNFINDKYYNYLKAGIYFELSASCWKTRNRLKCFIYLIKSIYTEPYNNISIKIILLPWLKNKLKFY